MAEWEIVSRAEANAAERRARSLSSESSSIIATTYESVGPSMSNPRSDDESSYGYSHVSDAVSETDDDEESSFIEEEATLIKTFMSDLTSLQTWVETTKAKGYTHLRDFLICRPGTRPVTNQTPRIQRYRCLHYGCHGTSEYLWPHCEAHSKYMAVDTTGHPVAKVNIPKGTLLCPVGIRLHPTLDEEEANISFYSQKKEPTYFFGMKWYWFRARKAIAKGDLLINKLKTLQVY